MTNTTICLEDMTYADKVSHLAELLKLQDDASGNHQKLADVRKTIAGQIDLLLAGFTSVEVDEMFDQAEAMNG